MAFCKNCGAEILDGAKFCKNCGAQMEAPAYSAPAAPAYSAPAAPAYEAPAYSAPAAPADTSAKPSIILGIVGMALGITSIEFGVFCYVWVMMFLSIPCGIVGLILSNRYLSSLSGHTSPSPVFGKVGTICSAIGLGLSVFLPTIVFFVWLFTEIII